MSPDNYKDPILTSVVQDVSAFRLSYLHIGLSGGMNENS